MAEKVIRKRKQQQRQAALRLVMMVAIIILVNILAGYFNINFDLTKEKRFTLSPATTHMLRNLKDVAVVDVYLEGDDFPAGFKRLQEATRERLKSFKEYAGSHVVFHFVNATSGKTNQEIYDEFLPKGMEPVNLETHGEKSTNQLIIPYALVHYNGNEMPVKLLETHLGMTPMEQLNLSESQLEYKLGNAIHKLSMPDKPRIAYIMGNGEPLDITTYDALSTLSRLYHVDTIDINRSGFEISPAYNAIIVNKPSITFTDQQKFKLDQYVMYGGHVLWMIDAVNVPMDSLQKQGFVLAMNNDLNLDDMLFRYGVRINPDLIEDMSCAPLAVVVGKATDNSGQPQMDLRPWIYFPILYPDSKHPIVNNMDGVFSRFASSIDTVKDASIKKTVLLGSSQYSRVAAAPIRVSLSLLQFAPREDMFKSPYHPVAVLLNGKFTSDFQNRLPISFLHFMDSLKHPFKRACDSNNSMIVVSDGDIMMNDYNSSGPLETGYWQYTHDHFANKSFLLNCMDYLTDPNSILEARSKDLRLRLLDSGRVEKERQTWQFVNIGIPVLIVLIFASAYIFFRKRRYEKKA